MAQTGTDLTRAAEEFLEAYNGSDWDKIRAIVLPDLVYIEAGRRIEGVDAYIQALETWKRAFPDASGTMLDILVREDTVAEEIRWEGTHTGPLETPGGTIAPTNKRIDTDAGVWTRFDGDRVREIHHYLDVFSLLAQIGALPQ